MRCNHLFISIDVHANVATASMKISKMLLHYGIMFTVPTAVAFFYWDPKSDDDIRKEVVRTYTSVTPLCALAH